MASAGNEIRIITTPLDPANWTLIQAPSDVVVGTVTCRNQQSVDVKIRSDSADPTTEDTIPAGFERTFRFSAPMPRAGLFYAKPASGTGPVVTVCNP
jgi:hypothetical protein